MKPITSAALDLLDRVLGLPKGGVQTPQLDDGNVVVNLPLGPEIVRRSRTLGASTGWFYGVLRNDHPNTGAGSLLSSIDPYDTGTSVPPYVDPLPADLEIWIERAALVISSGSATDFDKGYLLIDPTANQQAFGVDDGGGGVLTNPAIPLFRWDSAAAEVSAVKVGLSEGGQTTADVGIRVARGNTIQFASRNSAGAAALGVDCLLLLGVFPVAMGSDVAK